MFSIVVYNTEDRQGVIMYFYPCAYAKINYKYQIDKPI